MKTFAVVAILTACVAVAMASPVHISADWTAVAAKVGELEQVVRGAGEQLKTIANNDDPIVGAIIAVKVDAAGIEATAILNRANQAVSDQTLTEGQANQLTGELKSDLGRLIGSIQVDLALLSEAAATQIRAGHVATIDAVNLKARELGLLLRQP